jgi:hypothetical protein
VHRLCLGCGAPLPADLLLPEDQIRHFEKNMEQKKKAKLGPDANLQMPEIPLIPPGGS